MLWEQKQKNPFTAASVTILLTLPYNCCLASLNCCFFFSLYPGLPTLNYDALFSFCNHLWCFNKAMHKLTFSPLSFFYSTDNMVRKCSVGGCKTNHRYLSQLGDGPSETTTIYGFPTSHTEGAKWLASLPNKINPESIV